MNLTIAFLVSRSIEVVKAFRAFGAFAAFIAFRIARAF
jgi:hypothetical protein